MTEECAYRIRFRGFFCVYCGEIATAQDHFPPKVHTHLGYLLPVCHECNGLAGTEWPNNFELRAKHVKDKLRRKYRRALATPDWSASEIRSLGHTLKTGVIKWQNLIKITRQRIAWSALAYLTSIDRNNDFVPIFVEDDFLEAHGLSSLKQGADRSKTKKPIPAAPSASEATPDLFG